MLKNLFRLMIMHEKTGCYPNCFCVSPYIYAEDNWADDMELAAANQDLLSDALIMRRRNQLLPGWERTLPIIINGIHLSTWVIMN